MFHENRMTKYVAFAVKVISPTSTSHTVAPIPKEIMLPAATFIVIRFSLLVIRVTGDESSISTPHLCEFPLGESREYDWLSLLRSAFKAVSHCDVKHHFGYWKSEP